MSPTPAVVSEPAAGVIGVLADNPGPLTLDGTTTWLLHDPGSAAALLVDPGPEDPDHTTALLALLRERGLRVGLVVLTHHHADHTGGLDDLLTALAGVDGADGVAPPARAADAAWCRGGVAPLRDGELLGGDGAPGAAGPAAALTVARVVAAPGHTADSTCLHLPATTGPRARPALLVTGDAVLGRGSTVVDHLGDQLTTLARLRDLAAPGTLLLPAHGPVREDAAAVADEQLRHRLARLEQVRAVLAAGAATPAELVAVVHPGLDPALRAAAERSLRAAVDHLRHNRERG